MLCVGLAAGGLVMKRNWLSRAPADGVCTPTPDAAWASPPLWSSSSASAP